MHSAVTELFCSTVGEIMEYCSLFGNLVVCYYTCCLRFKRHRLFKDYKPSNLITTMWNILLFHYRICSVAWSNTDSSSSNHESKIIPNYLWKSNWNSLGWIINAVMQRDYVRRKSYERMPERNRSFSKLIHLGWDLAASHNSLSSNCSCWYSHSASRLVYHQKW